VCDSFMVKTVATSMWGKPFSEYTSREILSWVPIRLLLTLKNDDEEPQWIGATEQHVSP